MFIKSLLQEAPSPELDAVAKTLATECSEFISNPTPLFRGIHVDEGGGLLVRNEIRADRRSRSNREVGTILFNQMVEEEFGVADVRRRCHFLTNSPREAYKYGDMHLAFPVNGSKVLSSPSVADSMNNIGDIWHMLIDNLRGKIDQADVAKIMQVIAVLDDPQGSIESFFNMMDSVSDRTADAIQQNWDKAKARTLQEYTLTGVNAIPKYSQAVEYMIFDSSHTLLVNVDAVSHLLGTYDDGFAATFNALIQYTKSI